MPDDFDIPEFDEIESMMDGLLDGKTPPAVRPTPSTPQSAKRTPPPRSPGRRRPRLGPVTLGRFTEGVNWVNAAGFESPLIPPPEPRISGLSLGTFAAGVNWQNTANAAPLAGPKAAAGPNAGPGPKAAPQPTVDEFLSDFAWD